MSPSEPTGADRDREDPAHGEPGPDDLDAQFRAIVSGIDLALPGSSAASPPEDDAPPKPVGPGSFEELRAWVDVHPDLLGDSADGAADDEEPDDPAAHYEPPPPPPVPRGDRVSRWAWASAIGAPVGYVGLTLVGVDTGGPIGMALIAAFVAGFVTLVVRMKDEPRIDDDPDDGAVV